MSKQAIMNKLIQEMEALPQDRLSELYQLVHYFRLGLGRERIRDKNIKNKALGFFGIWKDITPEEGRVLGEIQSRRERTLRKRSL